METIKLHEGMGRCEDGVARLDTHCKISAKNALDRSHRPDPFSQGLIRIVQICTSRARKPKENLQQVGNTVAKVEWIECI